MKPYILLLLLGLSATAWAKPPENGPSTPVAAPAADAPTLDELIARDEAAAKADDATPAVNCSPQSMPEQKIFDIQKARCAQKAEADSALCKKVNACVPLAGIKIQSMDDAKREATAPRTPPKTDAKTAAAAPAPLTSKGPVRIGGYAEGEDPLVPEPAVYKPKESAQVKPAKPAAPAITAEYPPKTSITPKRAMAKPTQPLKPIPASTGNRGTDMANARSTLGAPETIPPDLKSMVLDGKGRYTSSFGHRESPCRGCSSDHAGHDIAAASGTPVYAAADGWVTRAGWSNGYGVMVEVKHAGGLVTRYAHLNADIAIPVAGTTVRQGQMIGGVGNTGDSTGDHLHFETRLNGKAINPMTDGMAYLASLRGQPLTSTQLAQLNANAATTYQTAGNSQAVGGIRTGSAPANTGDGGGMQLGGYPLPVNFMLADGTLAPWPGAQQQSWLSSLVQVALPIILLDADQTEAYVAGETPALNPSQNGKIPTNCTNQTTTEANNDLLREECQADDGLKDVGSGDALV